MAALSGKDGAASGSNLHQRASVGTTIYQLGQREMLAAYTLIRALNAGDVRHVHCCELRMQLTHRPRRPLRQALPLPAAGAGDTLPLAGGPEFFWRVQGRARGAAAADGYCEYQSPGWM